MAETNGVQNGNVLDVGPDLSELLFDGILYKAVGRHYPC
jgi:hypothetical protein